MWVFEFHEPSSMFPWEVATTTKNQQHHAQKIQYDELELKI